MSVVLVACLAAGGCSRSDNDTPSVLPSLTVPSHTSAPTPSTSTSTSAVPVIVPSPARPATPQGAAAFTRFFLGEVNDALAHADSRRLKSISEANCDTCRSYEKAADDLRDKNQLIEPTYSIVLSAEAPPENNGYVLVDVVETQPKRNKVDLRGRIISSFVSVPRLRITVVLHRVAGRRLVRGVQDSK